MTAQDALSALRSDRAHGLDDHTVAQRRAEYGENVLQGAVRRSPVRILLAQFTDVMVLVLLGAAAIAALLGEPEDIAAIVAIVLLNAILGFVQEYRAEQAMAALGAMAAPSARVRRNGGETVVPAHALVPGDIVLLEAGNIVPADLRLLDAIRLTIEEAALTGESLPVEKQTMPSSAADVPLGDRYAMAYKGTSVAVGRGVGLVVATGMGTELGRIAAMLRDEDDVRTPLQQRLTAFGRRLAVLVLGVCAAIFVTGLLRGEPVVLMFMTALSLAVAAIPEALPAVITVSLALGARRMVRQQALIRRLPAVETLGSVTYICTDKTGTLTENRMRVDQVRDVRGDAFSLPNDVHRDSDLPLSLAEVLVLCTDVQQAPDGTLLGDPTETALVRWAAEQHVDKATVEQQWPRVAELPFSSERARMTTVHTAPRGSMRVACTKGAPERVVPTCHHMWLAGAVVPVDERAVLEQAERMADAGLRVLAVAVGIDQRAPGDPVEALEDGQLLVALVGLLDPPRSEAGEAVRTCRAAGIQVVMITGDHPATARAIAQRLGIVQARTDRVLTGQELSSLDDEALQAAVDHVRVYARVAPEDKLRIVRALQAHGEYAAMTGDGVNDAPALKQANIGVAMGITGTEVSKEAAHVVLTDDNFSTIESAVEEGRSVFDNLTKFIVWTLPTNLGEGLVILVATMLGITLPILPVQILWINMTTAVLLGLMLAFEPKEPGIMNRQPRDPKTPILTRILLGRIVLVGLLLLAGSFGLFEWSLSQGQSPEAARTVAVNVFVIASMFYLLNCRSLAHSIFGLGLFSNPWIWVGCLLTILLQLIYTYVPIMQTCFHSAPIRPIDWLAILIVSIVVHLVVEFEKMSIDLWYRWHPAAPRP